MKTRIKTVEQLAVAAAEKRSVTQDGFGFGRQFYQPAVFVLNMPASVVLRRIEGGMFIYTPKKKVKSRYRS